MSGNREHSALWYAYKHDRAQAQADKYQQQADECSRSFHEIMAAVDRRIKEHIDQLQSASDF